MLGRMFGSEPVEPGARRRARPTRCSSASGSADAAGSSAPSSPTSTRSALELARALASRPQLLLLDEWLAGLNPTELQTGIELIRPDPRRRHHHRHDRARHGGDPRAVRPGGGDERRRADRGGHARPGAVRRRGDARLSRSRRCCGLSTSPSPTASTRRCTTSRSTSRPAAPRSSSAPTAPARRRCSRPSPAWCGRGPAAASCSRAAPIEDEPPHRIVAAGIALVPEGRRLFGDMTVIDNLRMGAYTRHARANEARQLEKQLALFPRLARAPQPAGQDHERRRAADAGDRPRPDVGAEDAAARRAVAGPGAAPGQGPVRDPAHASRSAGSRWCWWSRTCTRACAWPIASMCWRTAASCARDRPAEIAQDAAIQQAYLGLSDKRPRRGGRCPGSAPSGRIC